MLVIHRRAGKTVFAVNKLIRDLLECPHERPRGYYFAPTFRQAKIIAWEYLKEYTRIFPDAKFNTSELSAEFAGGRKIRLFGADNPDSARGIYADSVVIDEYAMMPPKLWSEVVRPALSDRKGSALFIGTPAGRNAFYDLYERAETLDDWGRLRLTAPDTGIIDPVELKKLRKEMADYEFEQEYLCSFDAAVRGAYYGREMAEAAEQGRVGAVPYDPALPVYTCWDLGIRDCTAVIWLQVSPAGQIRAIDCQEWHSTSLPEIISDINKKPYLNYAAHIGPHDLRVRELGTGTSRLEIAATNGVRFQVARNMPLMDGIDATRNLIRKMWFDDKACRTLVNYLNLYRREENSRGELGGRPVHDHTSHLCDALRYFAVEMGQNQAGNWGQGINYDLLDRAAV